MSPRSRRASCSSSAARPTRAVVETGRLFGVELMRARGREIGVETLGVDLVEALGLGQVLELVLAEVVEARARRHRPADQRAGRLRHEDLAAMCGRHDPRRSVDVDAHVDAGGQLGLAGMDPDTDLDDGASCPRLRGHRPLDPDRGPESVAGGPEDREERVTLCADLGADARAGGPDELVMPAEERSVVGSERLDEPGRALDVGEHESGGPGRQLGHRIKCRATLARRQADLTPALGPDGRRPGASPILAVAPT